MSTGLSRREALASITRPMGFLAAGGASLLTPRAAGSALVPRAMDGPADTLARDEDAWSEWQEAWTIDRTVINLNNGGVCPTPRAVQEAMERAQRRASTLPPPRVLWSEQQPLREGIRARLAAHWGCDPEELAFTRNASESLQICQFGIDLQPGDEILTSDQDYPRMLSAFRQREAREGVALRLVSLPVPLTDPADVVRIFREAITPRTRMILVCHMINLTGQVLPVRELTALGRARGIPVIVDGAHAMAHIPFTFREIDCDYYGVSLHKWLCAPHGTGLLYVRKGLIEGLWPLMASAPEQRGDIRKFEEVGTQPLAPSLAIAQALTMHERLGCERKAARLRYLRDRWVKRLSASLGGRFRMYTNPDPALSGGIATFGVDGLDTMKLSEYLWEKGHIVVTAIRHPQIDGLRISPNLYTTLGEIDRFCELVEQAGAKGIDARDGT